MSISVRRVVYQVLHSVQTEGAYVNLALQNALRQYRLDVRDKALCTSIVYGTVQRLRSLDAIISSFSSRKLPSLDNGVLTLLRMSAYQMYFLERVPAYAVIHEAVEICKQVQPHAAGFVNGVLRSMKRDDRPVEEKLKELSAKSSSWADAMGLLHSYPTWLVERFEAQYGRSSTTLLLETCNEPAHLSVRVNALKASLDDVLADASRDFPDANARKSVLSPDGIRFDKGIDVEDWPDYLLGRVAVQDEGAMLIAPLLHPAPHQRILDMCAAPGAKTLHIAELQGDKGVVQAVDVHAHKIALVDAALSRMGHQSVKTQVADARELGQNGEQGEYDAVLLDAPCSGFGVLRHRPDVRWRRKPQDIEALSRLQTELLTVALKQVRPGGIVVYSTCTLLREENEEVVQAVLNEFEGTVRLDDLRGDLPSALQPQMEPTSIGFTLLPHLFHTDGFFMVRLVRER